MTWTGTWRWSESGRGMTTEKTSFTPREGRSVQVAFRMPSSVKQHLEAVSDATGYTMTSLLEYAILRLTAAEFASPEKDWVAKEEESSHAE